jgi:hypothetical protein
MPATSGCSAAGASGDSIRHPAPAGSCPASFTCATRRLTAFEVVLGLFDSVGLCRTADARQAEISRGPMKASASAGWPARSSSPVLRQAADGAARPHVVKLPGCSSWTACRARPVNRRRVIEMVDRICRLSAAHHLRVTNPTKSACITHRLALAPVDAVLRRFLRASWLTPV